MNNQNPHNFLMFCIIYIREASAMDHELRRVSREFEASLHVRNVVMAKEKLEELNILAPPKDERNRYAKL